MKHTTMAFLGVPPEEEEIYRILLRKGPLDPGSSAPPDVGHALLEAGLARATPGGQLAPVSPARAIDAMIDRQVARTRADLEDQVGRSGIIDSLLAEQEMSAVGDENAPRVQRVDGLEAVRTVIDEMAFFVRLESLTTNPAGVMSPENIQNAQPLDARVLRRGASMRTIMGAAALDDPPTLSYLNSLVKIGAKVRIAHESIERLIICDRSVALTPIDPAHTELGALLTRESGLVAALVALFERMWKAAAELPDSVGAVERDQAEPLELAVLQTMCDVDKDEVGARVMGVSVRTYRKHVSLLLRRLNAGNRFQAALAARERGWI